ncbi:MAG TPA: hypothetical protein VI197_26835 [Polyangiaceae bacterium]
MVPVKSVITLAALGLLLAAGCEQKAKDGAPAGNASAEAPAASGAGSPAASAKPAEAPWYVGEWHAPLDVQRYQIEQTKEEGKIKAWADAADTKATGKGELTLKIDEAGKVTGTVTGPLGELAAAGMVDDQTLRVNFQPTKLLTPPEMFNGVLLAEKSDKGFAGDLKASSGDSLTVRKASVLLSKKDAKGN